MPKGGRKRTSRTTWREALRLLLAQSWESNYGLGLLALVAAPAFGSGIFDALASGLKWLGVREGLAYLAAGVLPLALLVVGVWLYIALRVPAERGLGNHANVEPRRAMIAALSPLFPVPERIRGSVGNPYPDVQEFLRDVNMQIDANRLAPEQARKVVWDRACTTNFGPLMLAVEVHSARLQYLYLATTPGETGTWHQYDAIKAALERLYPRLQVYPLQLPNENDVVAIAGALDQGIHSILTKAPREGERLVTGDLIIDFTGSTAAYTAGANLAALDDFLALQYTSQRTDIQLWDENGKGRDPQELDRLGKILEVRTNHTLAPKLAPEVQTTRL